MIPGRRFYGLGVLLGWVVSNEPHDMIPLLRDDAGSGVLGLEAGWWWSRSHETKVDDIEIETCLS